MLRVSRWISQFALILNQAPHGCGFGPTIQLTLWACGGRRAKFKQQNQEKAITRQGNQYFYPKQ